MYVELVGEYLEQRTPQLPRSSKVVALIYNVKAEEPSGSTLPVGHEPAPSNSNLLTLTPTSDLPTPLPFPQRVNDIYAEWDTMETVDAIRMALEEVCSVVMIEANEDSYGKLMEIRPDFAFNMSEGLYGVSREAQVPAMLEMLRIPYLGSDPLTLSVCLDKARAKEILSYHGVRTAPFTVVSSMEGFDDVKVRFPAIVKPLHEGSSKGIYNSCVVHNTEELESEVRKVLSTYYEPALVEDFLPGREFTVAMLGNGRDVEVLPLVEIKFDALPSGVNPIYSYEAKWIWDTSDKPLNIFECPAQVTQELRTKIELLCRNAYKILHCRDWSRIDVRLDAKGEPCIIEINPLPGVLPKPEDNSCFPKAARAAGMGYNHLIQRVLAIAMERNGHTEGKTAASVVEAPQALEAV